MTVADPQPQQKPRHRSWRDRLQAATRPAPRGTPPAHAPHKPCGDMADWHLMSAVDLKTPPPPAGDLLDALVEEHLQRAVAPAPAARPSSSADAGTAVARAEPAATLADPPATGAAPRDETANAAPHRQAMSTEARVAMLQREIEALLKEAQDAGSSGAGAPVGRSPSGADALVGRPSPDTDGPPASSIAPPPPAANIPQTPAPAPPPVITPAELDILVAHDTRTVSAKSLAALTAVHPSPDAHPAAARHAAPDALVSPAEAERKLTEAEGVLADELAHLIAESAPSPGAPFQAAGTSPIPAPAAQAAAPAAPANVAAELLAESDGVHAAEIAQLMAQPTDNPSAARQPAPATTVPAAPAPAAANAANLKLSPAGTPAAAARPAVPSVAPAAPAPVAASAPEDIQNAKRPTPNANSETHNAKIEDQKSLIHPEPIIELAPRRGPLQKIHRLVSELLLLLAQLLDLPFGWLGDLSKNVLGMAAFLLLLGGVVLFILSRVPGL